MLVDKKLTIENGFGDREFLFDDSLFNNLWYSIHIKKGSMFYDLNFGSNLHLLKQSKMTQNTYNLASQYVKEAIQWIVDSGRIKNPLIQTMQNSTQDTRLDITISALRGDNKPATYKLWYDLV